MSTDNTSTLDQAERLLTQKEFAGAIALARNELTSGSDQARAHFIYAEACARTGATAEAEPAYRQALTLQPGMQRARYGLAWLLQKGGQNEEALELIRQLLAEQHTHIAGLQLLCDALVTVGRPDEASPYLQEAEARAPANPQLQLLIGEWLVRKGAAAEGVARFRAMLEKKAANSGVWLALMREAEARTDFEQALE